jgi:hypothetical protein
MNRYPGVNFVLVCDNATYHRGERVRQLCDAAGIRLMYLPPYCPELNPIELCFAAVKQELQASQILNQTDNPEFTRLQVASDVMTAQLCYKLYRHCGYCVPVN